MTDVPHINKQNWGKDLQKRLGHLIQANGSFNQWSESPTVNPKGEILSVADVGYAGYNSSSFLFEEWDGTKWVEKPISFNGRITVSSNIELDLTQAYQFTISDTGAATGFGFNSLLESDIPFDVYDKNQVFYTSDLSQSFTIRGITYCSSIVSSMKYFDSLDALEGQTFTVYKKKDPPPQQSLSYTSLSGGDYEYGESLEEILVGDTDSIIPVEDSDGYIAYVVSTTVDTTSALSLAMITLDVESLVVTIKYPESKRIITGTIFGQSSISPTNFIIRQSNNLVPTSNFPLSTFLSHFVEPIGTGNITHSLPETRDTFSWSPRSTTRTRRSGSSSPIFPAASDVGMYDNSSSDNVYPVASILRAENGYALCGFHPYRFSNNTASGIKFFGRIYSSTAYPNLPSTTYVPYERMYLTPLGNLGIGNGLDAVTDRLHVDGSVRAVSFITDANASDISLKENIYPLTNTWNILKEIAPFSFTWKKNVILKEGTPASIDPESGQQYKAIPPILSDSMPDGIFVSYSAQEIQEKIAPEAVFTDGYGKLHLRKEDLVPYLHAALIELDAFYKEKIEDLESRLSLLEAA